MFEIEISQVTEITNLQLRKIAMRVVNIQRLAMEKALAHYTDPSNYAISADPTSSEQIFLSRFQQLSWMQQQATITQVMTSVKASPAERVNVYADLAQIDLHSPTSVETQVNTLRLSEKFHLPLTQLISFENLNNRIQPERPSEDELSRELMTTQLELRVHRVKCIKMMSQASFDADPDRLDLAGYTIDPRGNFQLTRQLSLETAFRAGVQKNYTSPKPFAQFNLPKGISCPKSYFITLVMSESSEQGNIDSFVKDLYQAVTKVVTATISEAVGVSLKPVPELLESTIGEVVGWVVRELFNTTLGALSDSIFPPQTVRVDVLSLDERSVGAKTNCPEDKVQFSAQGGQYWVWYDWQLTNHSSDSTDNLFTDIPPKVFPKFHHLGVSEHTPEKNVAPNTHRERTWWGSWANKLLKLSGS